VSVVADALGVARLGAAAVLPAALGESMHGTRPWLPLALAGVAIATDFVDGPLARRAGVPSRHGALLDNLADIAFVVAASATGARLGLVPWLAPAAMAIAFVTYVVASAGDGARAGWRPARSRAGHAAGVCNYALAVGVALAATIPQPALRALVAVAGLAVAALNLAAVLARLVGRPHAAVTLR